MATYNTQYFQDAVKSVKVDLERETGSELAHGSALEYATQARLVAFLFKQSADFNPFADYLAKHKAWLETSLAYVKNHKWDVKKEEAEQMQAGMKDALAYMDDMRQRVAAFDHLYNALCAKKNLLNADTVPIAIWTPLEMLMDDVRSQTSKVKSNITDLAGPKRNLEDKLKELAKDTENFTVSITH